MKKIGKYQIFSEIQRGPITHVYKAVQTELQRVVLLKQLNPDMAGDDELRNRFKQEGLVLAKIKSPNVITIYDFGEEDGIPYLVTEFIEGETLADVLAKHRFIPWDVTFYILHQLTEALLAIHDQDLIHQDIKPENIFISARGEIKLGDLGFSTFLKESEGAMQGTPAYLPPEIVLGAPLSFSSDLYSLGVVGYELLVGENPFFAENIQTVFNRIVNLTPTSIHHMNDEIPHPVSELVDRLINKNQEERFQTARELSTRLDQFLQSLEKPANNQIFLDYLEKPEEHQPTVMRLHDQKRQPETVKKKPPRIVFPLLLGLLVVVVLFALGMPEFRSAIFSNAQDSTRTNEKEKSLDEQLNSTQAQEDTVEQSESNITEKPRIPEPQDKSDSIAKSDGEIEPIINVNTKVSEILISSDPPRAFVFLGEDSLGMTPLKISIPFEETREDVELRHPAFPVIRKQIPKNAQSVQKIHIDLWREVGYLQISVVPWGEVWIDGDSVDVSPINRFLLLSPGVHELLVRHPKLTDTREQLYVSVGETLRKHIYLQPKH